jgi:hypothetical protein
MNRVLVTILVALGIILGTPESIQAGSTTLIILAFGYDPSQGVEWVQIKNISVGAINLGDYAIGDEETKSEGEGMFMLPGVNLGAGDTLTMRVRIDNDGSWPYTSVSNPTYCLNCTSGGYTNLTDYSDWSTGSPNFANDKDHIVLIDTNGGVGDGTDDDQVIDAVCWGSSIKDYIDFNNNETQDPEDPDIFLEDGCLSDISSGSYRRSNVSQDTDSQGDWGNNPTSVLLESFSATSTISMTSVLPTLGLLALSSVTFAFALAYRRRST